MKPAPIDRSEIVHHQDGGMSITGRDAMSLYRAVHLRSFIGLYAKTGIRPTRGVSGRSMLTMASEFTGKNYQRGAYLKAIDDLTVWIDTMKAAIPVADEREGAL
jgi:hypothetical protein